MAAWSERCRIFCAILLPWAALCRSLGDSCQIAEDEARVTAADQYLIAASVKPTAMPDISSKHAVIVVPTDPVNGGGGVGIDLYSTMPKKSVGGNSTTEFTKFVVVSSSPLSAHKTVALGNDVCGAAGYTDEAAVHALQATAADLGNFGPTVTNCSEVHPCFQRISTGLQDQLPFLSAMLGPTRTLKGNLLPIMFHGQGIRLASGLGDGLATLAKPGGMWAAERVLFVFVGDLSVGLPKAQAELCDAKAVEMVTQQGVPQIAEYFDTLQRGGTAEGCSGRRAAPKDFTSLLAAARVAAKLRLMQRRSLLSHRTQFKEDVSTLDEVVRGFASIAFWDDTRSAGEVLGAENSPALAQTASASDAVRPAARSRLRRVAVHS